MLGHSGKLWAVTAITLIGLSVLAARSCRTSEEFGTQVIAPSDPVGARAENDGMDDNGAGFTREVAAPPTAALASGTEPAVELLAESDSATTAEADLEQLRPMDLDACESNQCGSVVGHVSSAESGQPLVRHGLVFSNQKLGQRRVLTGPDGFYQVDDLAPGAWEVSYSGPAKSSDLSGFLRQGSVEVFANFVSEFSIEIQGRSLSGKFLRVGAHDGATLFLELRTLWDPEEIVASVEATTYHSALKVQAEHPELTEEDLPNSELGAFRLHGLLPDIYELRIVFGKDPESKEPYYLKQEVNLLRGDVNLGTKKFTKQDLAVAALLLKAAREAGGGD